MIHGNTQIQINNDRRGQRINLPCVYSHTTSTVLFIFMNCIKCSSKNNIHRHHVTYDPEVIVLLCKRCHKLITNINTLVAENYNERTTLTNSQRERLQSFFLITEIWILKAILPQRLLLLDKKQSHKKKDKIKKKQRILSKKKEKALRNLAVKFHGWIDVEQLKKQESALLENRIPRDKRFNAFKNQTI